MKFRTYELRAESDGTLTAAALPGVVIHAPGGIEAPDTVTLGSLGGGAYGATINERTVFHVAGAAVPRQA